jgi:hypothetical protein
MWKLIGNSRPFVSAGIGEIVADTLLHCSPAIVEIDSRPPQIDFGLSVDDDGGGGCAVCDGDDVADETIDVRLIVAVELGLVDDAFGDELRYLGILCKDIKLKLNFWITTNKKLTTIHRFTPDPSLLVKSKSSAG